MLISNVQFVIMIQIHPRFFLQCLDLLFVFSSHVKHHHLFRVHMVGKGVSLGGPRYGYTRQ